MKKISNLGTALNRAQAKEIKGGKLAAKAWCKDMAGAWVYTSGFSTWQQALNTITEDCKAYCRGECGFSITGSGALF